MADDIVFRRRQRLKYHFVNISKVLLYGYLALSDAAKITYQVIDGFDWEDKQTGESKGYAFPAVKTVAKIRGTSERSIQRHIKELEEVGLLTRQRRCRQASVLYIEDVSENEVAKYMEGYVKDGGADDGDKGNTNGGSGSASGISETPTQKSSNDKNVVSLQASQTTKMSVDNEANLNLGKEKEVLKNKNVNVVQRTENSSMQSLGQLMSTRSSESQSKRGRGVQSASKAKRDYLAQILADEFDDQTGLGCYRRIADRLPETAVYQLMAEVKDTKQRGRVRTRPAALFVTLAERYADRHDIDLEFTKKNDSRVSP